MVDRPGGVYAYTRISFLRKDGPSLGGDSPSSRASIAVIRFPYRRSSIGSAAAPQNGLDLRNIRITQRSADVLHVRRQATTLLHPSAFERHNALSAERRSASPQSREAAGAEDTPASDVHPAFRRLCMRPVCGKKISKRIFSAIDAASPRSTPGSTITNSLAAVARDHVPRPPRIPLNDGGDAPDTFVSGRMAVLTL